jgi:hypothetical protein
MYVPPSMLTFRHSVTISDTSINVAIKYFSGSGIVFGFRPERELMPDRKRKKIETEISSTVLS